MFSTNTVSASQSREIILDTETTGLSPQKAHRIVEIGCVEMIDNTVTGKSFQCYINPERDMPPDAEKIHGLGTDFLKNFPPFAAVADAFLEFIGKSPLVIHNAPFDMRFLHHELMLAGRNTPLKNAVIDTLWMAKRRFPGAHATLDALCQRFAINKEHRQYHGALLDAHLLAQVYPHLKEPNRLNLVSASSTQTEGMRKRKYYAPRNWEKVFFPEI